MNTQRIPLPTRRQFVGGLAKTMLLSGMAPQFIRAEALGRNGGVAANSRVGLAHIGVGGQGSGLLGNFLSVMSCESVVICDPYGSRRDAAVKTANERRQLSPSAAKDFREVVGRPDVDACIIATPDHWHVPIGLAAVRAGKDVYIEKPLGLSLNQDLAMQEACKATKRIFQYGTQQRAQSHIRKGIELVLNGAIGTIHRLDVWCPVGKGGGSLEPIPVPADLDYELYIGPAPMRECTKDRITGNASWYCSDYSIGFIAGWGAHPLDVAIWGMRSDQTGPWKIKGTGKFPGEGLFNNLTTHDLDITFADGVTMKFQSSDLAMPRTAEYRKTTPSADGTTFYGSNGWLSLSRAGFDANDMDMMRGDHPDHKIKVHQERDYYEAFIKAVQTRTPSIAPIEDAVRSDAISHLGLQAIKAGKEITWDPMGHTIDDPAGMEAVMDVPMRKPWTL